MPTRDEISGLLDEALTRYPNVPRDVAYRLVNLESGGNAAARSAKGALGLGQLMPAAAREMGLVVDGQRDDRLDPRKNIDASMGYLSKNIDLFGGDVSKGLAAYHAGPGAVERAGGIPNTHDGNMATGEYVRRLTGADPSGARRLQTLDRPTAPYRPGDTIEEPLLFIPSGTSTQQDVAAKKETGVLSDSWNALAAGLWGLGSDVLETTRQITDKPAMALRGAVESALGTDVVESVDRLFGTAAAKPQEWLKGKEQAAREEMSPETQAALEKEWWDDETDSFGPAATDWRSWVFGALQSVPGSAATMVPGWGLGARAAARAGKLATARGLAAGMPSEVIKDLATKAASRAFARTAGTTGAVLEGLQGGGASARNVRDQILKLPDDVLDRSEAFRALVEEAGGDRAKARAQIANDQATQAWVASTIATGAFAWPGDVVIGKIFRGELKGGIVKRFLQGASGEAIEEFPQSYLSRVSENVAMQGAGSDIATTAGAMGEGIGGAAAGGLIGGGMGASVGGRGKPGQRRLAPQAGGAPSVTPPVVKDDPFVSGSAIEGSDSGPPPGMPPGATQSDIDRLHRSGQSDINLMRDQSGGRPETGETGSEAAPEPVEPSEAEVKRRLEQAARMQDGDVGRLSDNAPFKTKYAAFMARGKQKRNDTHEVVELGPDAWVLRPRAIEEQEPAAQDTASTDVPRETADLPAREGEFVGDLGPATIMAPDAQLFPTEQEARDEIARRGLRADDYDISDEGAGFLAHRRIPGTPPPELDVAPFVEAQSRAPIEGESTEASKSIAKGGLSISFQGQTWPVSTVEEAGEKWLEYVDRVRREAGAGPRMDELIPDDPTVLDADGKAIGTLSLNGKFWKSKTIEGKRAPDTKKALDAGAQVDPLAAERAPGAVEAVKKYGLPEHTAFVRGLGLAKNKWRAEAEGESSNYFDTADDAAKDLRRQLDAVESGKKRAEAVHRASASAAEKIKRGEQPTPAEWKQILGDYKEGHRYARQPSISEFLTKYLGVPKHNIKGSIGEAAGTLTSDVGAKYPIVYLEKLAKVFGKAALDEAAHEAATSPTNGLPQPTEAQKEAGNYQKGHVSFQGLNISVENPKGSERSGTDKSGKKWSVKMKQHYGYIKGTVGKDKDHIDAFIGGQHESPKVFVVDQANEKGEFDEHKVMLGFDSLPQARAAYLSNYAKGWKGLGSITETTMDEFKTWLASGKTKQPFGETKTAKPAAKKPAGKQFAPGDRVRWNNPSEAKEYGGEWTGTVISQDEHALKVKVESAPDQKAVGKEMSLSAPGNSSAFSFKLIEGAPTKAGEDQDQDPALTKSKASESDKISDASEFISALNQEPSRRGATTAEEAYSRYRNVNAVGLRLGDESVIVDKATFVSMWEQMQRKSPATEAKPEVAPEAKKEAGEKPEAAPSTKQDDDDGVEAFLANMPTMQRSRALNVLNTNMTFNGKLQRRREGIREKVKDGATIVVAKDGLRRLQKPDGVFVDEKQITKIGMDYAAHLIGARGTAPTAEAPASDTAKRDPRAIHEIPLDEWKRIGKSAFVHAKGKRRIELLWNDVVLQIKQQSNGKLTAPVDDVLAAIHRQQVESRLNLERGDRSDASNTFLGAGMRERAQARLDEGKYVSPEVMAAYPDLAPKPVAPKIEAQHVDDGKIEAVTPEVIREAIKESARDTTMDLREARDAVLKKVDAALAKAKPIREFTKVVISHDKKGISYEVKDPTEKYPNATRHAEREDLAREIGYLTFKVEGDGRFKVLNTKESLKSFRDKLAHAGGFAPLPKSRPHKGLAGLPTGQKSMTPAVIEELWEDGEYLTAYEGAKAGGKPLMFGTTDDAAPSVYHSAASTEVAGYKAFVGKRLGRKKEEPWSVIEIDTGLAFGGGASAADAVSKAKERAAVVGKEKINSAVAKAKKISQEELERKFVAWATEQDQKLAEKSRMEEERAQAVADRDAERDAEQSNDGQNDDLFLSRIKEKIEEGGGSASIRGTGVQVEVVQRLIDNGRLVDVGSGYVGLPSSEKATEEKPEPAKIETKPVDVPEGYKKVTEFYRDGKQIAGYAEFAPGEQVRNKETRAIGEVESYVGEGPIFDTYLVKFPLGNQKLARRYIEAVVPEEAPVKKVPAEKARKPAQRESKKDKAEDGALVTRRKEFYTPGNVIRNDYGGDHDRVLEYRDNDPRDVGAWGVRVEKVEQRDGEWVATERPRWHSTEPDKKDAVVAKAPPKKRYEYDSSLASDSEEETAAKRLVVDAMNGDITVDALVVQLRDTGLPRGTLTAITERLGDRMSAEQQQALLAPEVEKRAAAKAPTESKASASIVDDVGENLKANRRNFKAGLTWDEIKSENAALKRGSVVKSRVWARPDYEAMVNGGMNPLVARVVKQVYDGIAKAPPRADDASLEGYIAAVNRVRDGLLAWTEDKSALATFGQETARAIEARKKGPFSRTPLDSRVLIERIWKDTPRGMAFRDSDAAKDMRLMGGNRFLAAVQIDLDGLLKATSDIIDGWPARKQAWQTQGYAVLKPGEYVVEQDGQHSRWSLEEKRNIPVEGVWRWTIKSKAPQGGRSNWIAVGPSDPSEGGTKALLVNDRSYSGFHGAFDTEQEALDGVQEIIAKQRKASGQDIRGTNVSGSERTGPDRRGKDEDISADRLMQTFGFRGVNFGRKGYIGEAERQAYVNAAYDAFHDLAEVLGVPPKALSLGGMLGIAFGAQGRGGHAAAHFVPGVNEINLTKGAGAGTLAHEWGHALDHYFARQAGLEAQSDPFMSRHLRTGADVRPEIVTQFKAIVEAMNKRAATPEEAEKRAADSIYQARHSVESWLKAIRGNTNPKESAATRFDELSDRIRKGDIGTGSFGALGLPQTIAELREVTKQVRGRHEIASNMKGLMAAAHHLKYVVENKDRAASHVPQVATNYARESSAADKEKGGKEYWRTPWEMFARAFESFVADKITAAGNVNTFLSDAQQRAAATVPVKDRDGTERSVLAFPYPRGVDREAVNKAFADLVSEIKVRDDGDMPVMFADLEALPGGQPGVVLRDAQSEKDAEALRAAVETSLQRREKAHRVPPGAFEVVALRDAPLLRRVGEEFKKRIVGFRVTDPKYRFFGGAVVPGQDDVIYVLADNPRPHLSILGHELVHELRRQSPELYRQFERAVRPYLASHWRQTGENAKAWKGHNDDKLMEEFLADLVGDGMLRRDFWQRLGQQNPNLLAKVYNAVLVLMDRIAKAIGASGWTPRTREYLLDFQAAVRIAADVMAEYGKQAEATKAAGDLSFAANGGPVWRSALAESMQKAPWSKAGDIEAAQFGRWLEARAKDGTFKPDELEWSGLKDWLAIQGPRVTRAAVVEYLAQNGVRVEETMLGEGNDTREDDDLRVRLDAAGYDVDQDHEGNVIEVKRRSDGAVFEYDGNDWVPSENNEVDDPKPLPDDVARMATRMGEVNERIANDESNDKTRYGQYVLPGGENYRELLLTLPPKDTKIPDGWTISEGERLNQNDPDTEFVVRNESGDLMGWGATRNKAIASALSEWHTDDRGRVTSMSGGPMFVSGHFAQPNILAHVRFNERTSADGSRVLFLEEIQSDWAQKGRKHGFVAPEAADRFESPVLDAPFVTKTEAWVALAIKRMIRYAADNGFDAIAWTNGEQQNDRYKLSSRIDKIEWGLGAYRDHKVKTKDREIELHVKGHASILDFIVDENGVVVQDASHSGLVGKHLSDVIGKDLAAKIMERPDGIIKGLDLNVGGEGMRAFYDRIVPNVANDLLKKMGGGRVGTINVDSTDFGKRGRPKDWNPRDGVTTGQPGFRLTDAMRAQADRGMPMFAGLPLERDRSVIDTANRRIGKFVDEFVAGRMKDGYTQIIGPTPTALQAVGAPALDMQIDGALVRKVLDGKHADGMSPDLFKAMAEGLYNPLAVFDSPDENGKPGMLALTEAVDRKGEPVIIAVHMERAPHRVKINDVASMYGLERAEKRLAKMKLLYVRNEKGPAPSTTPAGPYMAGMVQAARGRGEIVLTERDVVNRFGPSFDRLDDGGADFASLDDGPTAAIPGLGTVTRQRVNDHLEAMFRSSRTFNLWHRTVGTQFHKARVDEHFRPVFEEAQRFLFDTSQFTMNAADKAPGLLPRLERLRDTVGHVRDALSPARRADRAAVAKAIFKGTLANTPEPPPGLTEYQRNLFDQARAAIDASLDDLSVSVAANQLMVLNRSSRKGGRGNAVPPAMIEAMKRSPGEAEEAFNSALNDAERMASEDYQKAIDASAIARGTPQAERTAAEASAAEIWLQTVRKAQKDVGRVFEKANKLKADGYAPLMRFGRYTVTVRDGDGKVLWFSMHEAEADAKRRAREVHDEFPSGRVETSVMSQERWKLYRGVSPETLAIFADEAGLLSDPAMQQYLQIAVSNRSALKRLIHRKGTAGYDEDLQRVLSAFVLSNARMASRNYHFGMMTDAAAAVPESKGDVADEATKLVNYVQNPEEEAGTLRGFLFVNYLGGSVASALVNMTQPFTMTLPFLSQYGGARKAASALTAGMSIALGNTKPDADLAAALKRATDDGIVAPHEIHQLQAEAIRGFWSNPLVRSGMMVWGSLFSLAEQFNRRATFAAAYDIARGMEADELRERGFGSAFQFAERAVEDTQGIYAKSNRPNWARGPIGATVMTFKQFSIAYLEFLVRLPPKERLLALAILVLAAGLQGLPFAEDIEDLVDTVGQSLGYRTNSRRALRELAVRTLGEPLGKFLTSGASAIPGVPLDVQGRLGMGNLIPGTGAIKRSETNRGDDALEVLGPAGGLVKSVGSGVQAVLRGDVADAAKGLAPVAVQNAMRAVDMWQTGQYRDRGGRKVIDTDTADAAFKAIGFQPNRVAKLQRLSREVQQDVGLVRQVEAEIASTWAEGRLENDQSKIDRARAKLRDWNEKNPGFHIKVDASQINRRVKEMRAEKVGRLIKSAPREVRKAVSDELQE